eukprot:s1044_g3.t1
MQVPRAHQQRLFDAIDEWNREKSRETQRPQWATHSSPAHILAIVDTPVPSEFRRDTTGTATTEADTADTAAASSSTTRVTHSSVRPPMPPPPSRVLGADAKAKAAPAKGGKKGEKGEGKPTQYHAERQENAPWRRDDRSWGSGSDRNDWSAGGHRDWHGGSGWYGNLWSGQVPSYASQQLRASVEKEPLPTADSPPWLSRYGPLVFPQKAREWQLNDSLQQALTWSCQGPSHRHFYWHEWSPVLQTRIHHKRIDRFASTGSF